MIAKALINNQNFDFEPTTGIDKEVKQLFRILKSFEQSSWVTVLWHELEIMKR